MSIPDYQSLMLPLLKIAADGKVHTKREALNDLSSQFGLTEDERKELLPSGNQEIFSNRLGWARTYLKKAGLIQYTHRGHFQITDRGKQVLSRKPEVVNVGYLRQFPEFREFHSPKRTPTDVELTESPESQTETPEELLASGSLKLRRQAEQELLARVKACPAEFFELLVVKLLTTIGYGGSLADAGKAIGKAGDGGIDGVIKEDKLGLDLLYIQGSQSDCA